MRTWLLLGLLFSLPQTLQSEGPLLGDSRQKHSTHTAQGKKGAGTCGKRREVGLGIDIMVSFRQINTCASSQTTMRSQEGVSGKEGMGLGGF